MAWGEGVHRRPAPPTTHSSSPAPFFLSPQTPIHPTARCVIYPVIAFCHEALANNGTVVIHCVQGVSRSCAAAIAVIMWMKAWSYDEAWALVRAARPICAPNVGFECQLLEWFKRRDRRFVSPWLGMVVAVGGPRAPSTALLVRQRDGVSHSNLDPRNAFVLHWRDQAWIWIGCASDPNVERAARAFCEQLRMCEGVALAGVIRQVRDVKAAAPAAFAPDTTKAAFWAAMGGHGPVDRVKRYDADVERLRAVSRVGILGRHLARFGSSSLNTTLADLEDSLFDSVGNMSDLAFRSPPMTPRLRVGTQADRGAGHGGSTEPQTRVSRQVVARLYSLPALEELTHFDTDDLHPDERFVMVVLNECALCRAQVSARAFSPEPVLTASSRSFGASTAIGGGSSTRTMSSLAGSDGSALVLPSARPAAQAPPGSFSAVSNPNTRASDECLGSSLTLSACSGGGSAGSGGSGCASGQSCCYSSRSTSSCSSSSSDGDDGLYGGSYYGSPANIMATGCLHPDEQPIIRVMVWEGAETTRGAVDGVWETDEAFLARTLELTVAGLPDEFAGGEPVVSHLVLDGDEPDLWFEYFTLG